MSARSRKAGSLEVLALTVVLLMLAAAPVHASSEPAGPASPESSPQVDADPPTETPQSPDSVSDSGPPKQCCRNADAVVEEGEEASECCCGKGRKGAKAGRGQGQGKGKGPGNGRRMGHAHAEKISEFVARGWPAHDEPTPLPESYRTTVKAD